MGMYISVRARSKYTNIYIRGAHSTQLNPKLTYQACLLYCLGK